ncbi:hypothetical protein J6590_018519 [Homalodisca vitripennis]|nr:hypothetical protein J6590_018519 [Homalodisca vitripennis]
MMIEADIVAGHLSGAVGGPPLAVMGHPPTTVSDLSLEQFLDTVLQRRRGKGIKLDFKTTAAFRASENILEQFLARAEVNFPVWVNADILRGPGIGPGKEVVDPHYFLRTCVTKFPLATISAGWAVNPNSSQTLSYSSAHIDEMTSVLMDSHVVYPVTFPVHAGIAANSLDTLTSLVHSSTVGTSLTLWAGEGQYIDYNKLRLLINTIGKDKYLRPTLSRILHSVSIFVVYLTTEVYITVDIEESYAAYFRNVRNIHELWTKMIVLYTLIVAVKYSGAKISAALNMAVIENHLELKGTNVSLSYLEKSVTLGMSIVYLVHLNENLLFFVSSHSNFTKRGLLFELCDTYFNAVKCSCFFGFFLFATKYLRIKNFISEDLEGVKTVVMEENTQLLNSHQDCPQKQLAWAEYLASKLKKINLLKQIEGTLVSVEEDLRVFYWIYLAWIATVSVTWTPLIVFGSLNWNLVYFLRHKASLSSYIGFTIAAVAVFQHVQLKKESAESRLSAILINSCQKKVRKDIKHRLLACYHRNSPFRCYLFDLDISLLVTILDISLMTLCAKFSS